MNAHVLRFSFSTPVEATPVHVNGGASACLSTVGLDGPVDHACNIQQFLLSVPPSDHLHACRSVAELLGIVLGLVIRIRVPSGLISRIALVQLQVCFGDGDGHALLVSYRSIRSWQRTGTSRRLMAVV